MCLKNLLNFTFKFNEFLIASKQIYAHAHVSLIKFIRGVKQFLFQFSIDFNRYSRV
jgi:hypothetical protein